MTEMDPKLLFHAQVEEVDGAVSDALRESHLPAVIETTGDAETASQERVAPYREEIAALMQLVELVATGVEGKDYVIVSGNSGVDQDTGVVSRRTVYERAGTKKDGVVRQLVVSDRSINQTASSESRLDAQLEARWDTTIASYLKLKGTNSGEAIAQRGDVIERLVSTARTPIGMLEFSLRETTYEPLDNGRFNVANVETVIGIRTEEYIHGRHQAFPVFYPTRDGRNPVPQYALPIIRTHGEKPDIEAAPYHAVSTATFKNTPLASINVSLGAKNIGFRR